MAKCDKCGREYVKGHVRVIQDGKPRGIPQPKQGCPYCDKDQNRENQRKFLKDLIERTSGSKPTN